MKLSRRRLGRTGYDVTFIGFGALEIGRNWGLGQEQDRAKPAETEAAEVLNGVLDLGINLIDTAAAYHYSEERIGRALAERRGEYFLASKAGEHTGPEESCYYDFSEKAIADSIDRSRHLLQTDRIDLLQIHFGPDPHSVLDNGETVRAMLAAKETGKVRFLGASPPSDLIPRCLELGVFDVLQVAYSLLDRSAEAGIAAAAEQNVGILIRSGFAGGLLTPRALKRPDLLHRVQPYVDLLDGDIERLPALALGFLRQNPGISSVLVGTKSLNHLEQNITQAEADLEEALVAAATRLGGGT